MASQRIGYVRVSSLDQNPERQLVGGDGSNISRDGSNITQNMRDIKAQGTR